MTDSTSAVPLLTPLYARPLDIGTYTPWGRVQGVGFGGDYGTERYYWIVDAQGGVAFMDAYTVERGHYARRR